MENRVLRSGSAKVSLNFLKKNCIKNVNFASNEDIFKRNLLDNEIR